ncbi:carbon-nitrogen hydrolase family protein [Veronia pacifica]|uniref:CN hydrolase domain-containing protein n=1 Tax=Veronia pacifica TaxID=1080227 RepID=A0A1C3EIG7_9GAMM|nr:carbon-nitrogen hydrolase family protein [Veronia pacifica]ODA33018.1 hypothetical protein A8L45_12060 [Veronia pacifica]
MKLGIVQMPMAWTVEENTQFICKTIQQHAHLDGLIFPELSISGFHRKIVRESKPDKIRKSCDEIAEASAQNQILVFAGAPLIESGLLRNSYLVFDRGCVRHQWHKVGLTNSEATVFEPAYRRDIYRHESISFSALICREASDVSWFVNEFKQDKPDIILWPCYIGQWSTQPDADSSAFESGVKWIAQQLGCYVLQCNWPQSLNEPDSTGLGGSKVVAPDGRNVALMPYGHACVGIFDSTNNDMTIGDFDHAP